MSDLIMAFYGEGNTDYRFLTRVIERTALRLRPSVEIFPMHPFDKADVKADSEAETIRKAAAQARGMHLLVYHLDADGPVERVTQTRQSRFEPGMQLVQEAGEGVCPDVIPVIPVHMLEAWLLADPDALIQAVGTRVNVRELGLPEHPQQVEAVPDPKMVLREALSRACQGRSNRRHTDAGLYFARLGDTIRLDRLDGVSAYVMFKRGLEQALNRLHI